MDNLSVADLGGVPPGPAPRSRVLRHYPLIEGARSRGWSWEQIGTALGMSGDTARKAVVRVRRAIAAGRIDAEALQKAATPPAKSQRPQPQRSTRPQAETHNAQTLREMGVHMIGEDS